MPRKYSNKTVSQVRFDATLFEKIRVVSAEEGRSINAQIEFFAKKGVEAWEAVNGEIKLPDESPDSTEHPET